MHKRVLTAFCAAAVAVSGIATPALAAPSHAGVSLVGAGSTFDFPFFDAAFKAYGKKAGVTVNYQPVGSGAGIASFTSKLVDFGASDVPMNPTSELPAAVRAGGAVEQIPIALGGVSIAYNIPGVKGGLHLNSETIAGIFLGTIKNWNSKTIKKLNPKVHLPNLAITVVHRSDGSGTSFAFTDYLSKVSDVWRGNVGTSKTPPWPTGVGGKGNLGVAQLVQSARGAIGYVELAYVLQTHMHQAMIENRAHHFEFATPKTVAADAAGFKHIDATHYSIVNGSAKTGYPIATYSWLLVFRHQSDHAKGKALVALLKWLTTTGQSYAKKLQYVPLPKNVQHTGLGLVKQIKF